MPNQPASRYPATAAHIPTSTARTTPVPSAERTRGSRTGTWVPATNITSAKPMSARKENNESEASRTPNPVVPKRIPVSSSPTITGTCHADRHASNGPARPSTNTRARVEKVTTAFYFFGLDFLSAPVIFDRATGIDTSLAGMGMFSSV